MSRVHPRLLPSPCHRLLIYSVSCLSTIFFIATALYALYWLVFYKVQSASPSAVTSRCPIIQVL